MFCLDTNVLIDILRGEPSVKSKFVELLDEDVSFSPIALCEVVRGAYRLSDSEKEIRDIDMLIGGLDFLEFTPDACMLFGKLDAELHRQGRPTQALDLMIACIAMDHDATLITRNGSDFKNIPGLKLVVW